MTDALHEQAHARTDEKLDQIDQKLEALAVALAELKLQAGIGRWIAVTAIPAGVALLVSLAVKAFGN